MRERIVTNGLVLVLAAAVGASLLSSPASADTPRIPPEAKIRGKQIVLIKTPRVDVPVVDGEFVVDLRREGDLRSVLASEPFRRHRARALPLTTPLNRYEELAIYRVDFPAGLDMVSLQEEIARNPLVERSDPNVLAYSQYFPGDEGFGKQWSLYNDGQTGGTLDADIDVTLAWDSEKGDSAVSVFVIDTGIAMQDGVLVHPDLDSDLVVPYSNVLSPGSDPVDDMAHGTHVAGIIAAEMNNPEGGTVGVCPGCSLKIIKALEGAALSDQIDAVTQAIQYAADAGDPTVVNMSWRLADGYDIAGEGTFESLMAFPSKNGLTQILFVVAAGNYCGTFDTCDPANMPVVYPAAYAGKYQEVIAVAATDHNDKRASFSAFGPEITVAAPGDDVYSTTPPYPVACMCPPEPNYDEMSGTSMAAPHVAGIAGLLWSADTSFTALEVRSFIVNGAEKVGDDPYAEGRNDYMGFGRVNACKSLKESGVAPWKDCLKVPPTARHAGRTDRADSAALASACSPFLAPFLWIGLLKLRKRRG